MTRPRRYVVVPRFIGPRIYLNSFIRGCRLRGSRGGVFFVYECIHISMNADREFLCQRANVCTSHTDQKQNQDQRMYDIDGMKSSFWLKPLVYRSGRMRKHLDLVKCWSSFIAKHIQTHDKLKIEREREEASFKKKAAAKPVFCQVRILPGECVVFRVV